MADSITRLLRPNDFKFTENEFGIAMKVARFHANDTVLPREDLEGTLILWLEDNWPTILRYRTDPHGKAKLFTALRNFATDTRQHELNHSEFRMTIHDNTWTTKEIKHLLRHMGTDREQSPSQNLELVRGAFYSLSKPHRDMLSVSYIYPHTIRQVIELTDKKTVDAVKSARRHALNALKQKLNGLRDTYGSKNFTFDGEDIRDIFS